jgi:hypothetical protein
MGSCIFHRRGRRQLQFLLCDDGCLGDRNRRAVYLQLGCPVVSFLGLTSLPDLYSDKASGKSMAGRPELARALDDLDDLDELVIAEWDRATRSMWDGLQIIKAVIDAGAAIKVLDRPYIDLDTPRLHGDDVGHG